MIQITFLGTNSMMPTIQRNQSATLLTYKNENILLDCGEGTQRQLRFAKISPAKITRILISHWHGDHILGLPGLLQTIGASGSTKQVKIYGPIHTKSYIATLKKSYITNIKVPLEIHEITKPGICAQEKEFTLEAVKLEHSAPCLGYIFREKDTRKINLEYTEKFGLTQHPLLGELQKGKSISFKGKKISVEKATFLKKGKKIAFITDTVLTSNCIKLAKDADLVVCEATFSDVLKDKAREYKHLTAKQAAQIAKKANAKKLILNHFSQRYTNIDDLEKEAKTVFKNTLAAKDLMYVIV